MKREIPRGPISIAFRPFLLSLGLNRGIFTENDGLHTSNQEFANSTFSVPSSAGTNAFAAFHRPSGNATTTSTNDHCPVAGDRVTGD